MQTVGSPQPKRSDPIPTPGKSFEEIPSTHFCSNVAEYPKNTQADYFLAAANIPKTPAEYFFANKFAKNFFLFQIFFHAPKSLFFSPDRNHADGFAPNDFNDLAWFRLSERNRPKIYKPKPSETVRNRLETGVKPSETISGAPRRNRETGYIGPGSRSRAASFSWPERVLPSSSLAAAI